MPKMQIWAILVKRYSCTLPWMLNGLLSLENIIIALLCKIHVYEDLGPSSLRTRLPTILY
jgi:hypothetical protein